MSDKDREAFEKWVNVAGYDGSTAESRIAINHAHSGWQAALTHSAEKDAEIERLKSKLAGERMARSLDEAEISRLQRVVKMLADGLDFYGSASDDDLHKDDGKLALHLTKLAAAQQEG
jgi:hypothetical protein